jgi:hypothetical protein
MTGLPACARRAGSASPATPNIRALIDQHRRLLSLHGHMHRPASAIFGRTQVECLAITGYRTGDPLSAVGIWDINPAAGAATRLA